MDPITLMGLGLTLLQETPALINFFNNTFSLFKGGTITADQLAAMWTDAGNAVKAAEAKWKAAAA